MNEIYDTIAKMKANVGMLNEQPIIARIARKEILRLIGVLRKQITPDVVVSKATRSPLNKQQWSCDLECGHTLWVTSKSKPKIVKCDSCCET